MEALKGKLTQKNKNLVLALVGIILFLAVYFLGYQNLTEKDTEIQNKSSERSAYYEDLKVYYDNVDIYKASTYDLKNSIDEMLEKLPRDITSEDFLLYLMELNDKVGSDMLSVAFQENQLVSEFPCIINDKEVTVQGYSAGTSSNSTMTYEQFKEYLDYVYKKTDDVTFINSIAVTYDGENAKLNATVELVKYYVTFDGADYEAVPVPQVSIGLSDLFGTVTANADESEDTENNENIEDTEDTEDTEEQ